MVWLPFCQHKKISATNVPITKKKKKQIKYIFNVLNLQKNFSRRWQRRQNKIPEENDVDGQQTILKRLLTQQRQTRRRDLLSQYPPKHSPIPVRRMVSGSGPGRGDDPARCDKNGSLFDRKRGFFLRGQVWWRQLIRCKGKS